MIRLAACAFALVLLGAPLSAQPQPGGKVPRIGWLTSSTIHEPNVAAFREGMRILGYAEVSIEFRAAAGDADRLPTFASELARLKLDVILVDGARPP